MRTCFVIMPIADGAYENGHFKRVYDHVIVPSCKNAGFIPVRADEVRQTNQIVIDIIKRIIVSDMAICDLSGRNPNVLYELGIRQAFNKPVTLIKDIKTDRIFDIQGFRDMVYDESLRVDAVDTAVSELTEMIKNTYENHEGESNSLISLLGVSPAKLGKVDVSPEAQGILDALNGLVDRITSWEKMLNSRNFDKGGSSQEMNKKPGQAVNEYENFVEGDVIEIGDEIVHPQYGLGKVLKMSGSPDFQTMVVDFGGDIGHKNVVKRNNLISKAGA